jgi:putative DNA primase/helicase
MTGLAPSPDVPLTGSWHVLATQAGRFAYGLRATVQLWEGGTQRESRTFDLDDPDEAAEVIEVYAVRSGATAKALKEALAELQTKIELALRRQADAAARPKKPDDDVAEAQRQGPAIASCFVVDDAGVWYHPPGPPDLELPPADPIWICAPLLIYGATRDELNDNHGHAVRFADRHGVLQHWAMPLEFLEDKKEYRRVLRRLGLRMSGSAQGVALLQLYLEHCHSDVKMRAVEKIGWHGHVYVLPDETIGQEAADERIVLQGLTNSVEGYRCKGTLAEWQAQVGRLCVDNSRLALAVSAAFAAPLLTPLGMEGGGIHLRGPSSEGKTSCLMVGASVWGEPARIESWRATCNGLEGVAALHNDCFLLLDELKEIDPREAAGAAYLLGNGQGKRRGRPQGGTRPRLAWRTLFLSSGEVSLAQHVEAVGIRVHAGQEVRLIDLPADAGGAHGLFEHLHGCADGQKFADLLRLHVREAYGQAGRAFVTKLTEAWDEALAYVRTILEAFVTDVVPDTATGQVRRVATKFALVGAAGELASKWIITGWDEGVALQAAGQCFNAWLGQRGVLTNADEDRALRQVRLFFEKHGESRFHPWDAEEPPQCLRCKGTGRYAEEQACFGCNGTGVLAVNGSRPVQDRAGFWRETLEGRREFYVFPQVFEKELSRTHDPVCLAKLLVQRGWVKPDAQHRPTRVERLPTIGTTRVYRFLPAVLSTNETQETDDADKLEAQKSAQ